MSKKYKRYKSIKKVHKTTVNEYKHILLGMTDEEYQYIERRSPKLRKPNQ